MQAANRKNTRQISVGTVKIGGNAPVSVQSMTKTDTRDARATLEQIRALAAAGCDLVRLAVPDHEAAAALAQIIARSPLPLIADIHFDHTLALAAIAAGVHGLRLNPGNIGAPENLKEVVAAARRARIPIRVGVNGGSLPPRLRRQYGGITPEAICECALEYCRTLAALGLEDVKVSLKASDVPLTVAACRLFSAQSDYPLHLGVTEAGSVARGIVKSAVGIGALLLDGIGDTIRVSLTGDPVAEVRAGIQILEAAGLRQANPELISCPTCGRTGIDVCGMVARIELELERLAAAGKHLKLRRLAVMGCPVNGPGEAREADLGVAGGPGGGIIFSNGQVLRRVPAERLLDEFIAEIRRQAE